MGTYMSSTFAIYMYQLLKKEWLKSLIVFEIFESLNYATAQHATGCLPRLAELFAAACADSKSNDACKAITASLSCA